MKCSFKRDSSWLILLFIDYKVPIFLTFSRMFQIIGVGSGSSWIRNFLLDPELFLKKLLPDPFPRKKSFRIQNTDLFSLFAAKKAIVHSTNNFFFIEGTYQSKFKITWIFTLVAWADPSGEKPAIRGDRSPAATGSRSSPHHSDSRQMRRRSGWWGSRGTPPAPYRAGCSHALPTGRRL